MKPVNKYLAALLFLVLLLASNFCTYSLTKSYYFKLGKLKTALDYYLVQLGIGIDRGEKDNEEEADSSILKGL